MTRQLEGRRVFLRPVTPADYSMLHALETSGALGVSWRFRGATPSPEEYVHRLWEDVLAQYLICRRRDGQAVGLVLLYNANFGDGWGYLAGARFDPDDRTTAFLEGSALFVEHVFATWPFHKVYAEATDLTYETFASGAGEVFEVEGRLRNHRSVGAERVDQIILSCTRERWNGYRDRLMAFARGSR
jgi:RimJ/RimL family protein N-acetyltransferase